MPGVTFFLFLFGFFFFFCLFCFNVNIRRLLDALTSTGCQVYPVVLMSVSHPSSHPGLLFPCPVLGQHLFFSTFIDELLRVLKFMLLLKTQPILIECPCRVLSPSLSRYAPFDAHMITYRHKNRRQVLFVLPKWVLYLHGFLPLAFST